MEDKSKGLGTVSKVIGDKRALPLSYVRRDKAGPQGQPKNSYATDPKEIYGIIKRACNKRCEGNKRDMEEDVPRLYCKSRKHIFESQQFQL